MPLKKARKISWMLLVCLLLGPLSAEAEKVASLPNNAVAADSAQLGRAAAFRGSGGPAYGVDLPETAIDTGPTAPGPHKTGAVQALAAPVTAAQLAWEPIIGGYAARVHVVSRQAKRLRLHIANLGATPSIEFRVQGSLDQSPSGPVAAHPSGDVWLPVSNGNSADLEIFVDAPPTLDTPAFKLDAANPIVADTGNGELAGMVEQNLGLSQYPEFDFACWAGNNDLGNALAQAAGATAKVNFISNGSSYSCTGTLLNDKRNTRTPWFATAYHCIHDQATADTATFEWFFQATSCGGSARDPRYAQTGGGAQLLWADFTFDPAFLKLNKPPPGNAVFVGWDTGIQVGDQAWGVHHPRGDHTMVSQGRVAGLLQTEQDASQGGIHVLDIVNYAVGGTEPGSSGSGLFSLANGNAYWRGTLFGGPDNNYQTASYSHLNSYYNNLKPWLENAALPSPTVSVTAAPATINYLGSATLNWSSIYASACNATTSDGWAGPVATSGSQAVSPGATTTYTLYCAGSGGSASQAVKVTVNPPPTRLTECLFAWAENQYPWLLAPAGIATQFTASYTFRYYWYSQAYVGISSANNHVYYGGPGGGVVQDIGTLASWLDTAACR